MDSLWKQSPQPRFNNTMQRVLVVTNASHDNATNYLEAWSQEFMEAAQKHNETKLLELRADKATRKVVEDTIGDENPGLVIFNGHGSPDSIFGYNQEVLIKQNENDSLLSKRIVHALACKSGLSLGPNCISLGSIAYVGYKENFKFITEKNRDNHEDRRSDPYAAYFLNPAFSAIIAIVEGKSVGEAYRISQDYYAKNLLKLITSPDDVHSKVMAPQVYHNLRHQVCLGDTEATF